MSDTDLGRALARYDEVVEAQGVDGLVELDRWYREALPVAIAGRDPKAIEYDDLVQLTRWKMKRGEWRARNLEFVRGNDPEAVRTLSVQAIASAPDLAKPIRLLCELHGVGPATASAVMAAARPWDYPFLDDVAAGYFPALGKVAYTPRFYVRYAEAIRAAIAGLPGWTPVMLERALWAHAGGKAGKA